jgi:hypothetical protein
VFRNTVSEVVKLGVNILPTTVNADFETAIHNGVTTVWPGLVVKACLLHLGHCWWWKMQSLGLSKHMERKVLK